MVKRQSKIITFTFILLDLIVLNFSYIAAIYLRFILPIGRTPSIRIEEYILLGYILNPLFIGIFALSGLYKPRGKRIKEPEFWSILRNVTIGVLFVFTFTFFYRKYTFSRLILGYFWVLSVVLFSLSRMFVRFIIINQIKKGINVQKVLIVGYNNTGRRLKNELSYFPELAYQVIGFIDKSKNNKNIKGTIKDIRKIIEQEGITEIYITLPAKEQKNIIKVMKICEEEGIRVRLVPNYFDFLKMNLMVEELGGIPVISMKPVPLNLWYNALIKRIFDIIFSVFVIIICSPLFVIIPILIKLTSHGPVIFKQARIGLDNKPFTIYKFRTMRADAEKISGPVWAKKDDPRRTKLGKILRQLSLDELPQFFNVLKGDMSVVGPRPERPVFVKKFKKEVEKYMQRHQTKAGITGWAQVLGWRGNTSIKKRIEADIWYIEHWSLWLDIKIIFMTIFKGAFAKNAY